MASSIRSTCNSTGVVISRIEVEKKKTRVKMTQVEQQQSSSSLRRLGLCSQITTQHSPIVFPEKRSKSKVKSATTAAGAAADSSRPVDHTIDIPIPPPDENTDLLGYLVYTGKLVFDKSTGNEQQKSSNSKQDAVDAKLTTRALVWGSHILSLDDVISVCVVLFEFNH